MKINVTRPEQRHCASVLACCDVRSWYFEATNWSSSCASYERRRWDDASQRALIATDYRWRYYRSYCCCCWCAAVAIGIALLARLCQVINPVRGLWQIIQSADIAAVTSPNEVHAENAPERCAMCHVVDQLPPKYPFSYQQISNITAEKSSRSIRSLDGRQPRSRCFCRT